MWPLTRKPPEARGPVGRSAGRSGRGPEVVRIGGRVVVWSVLGLIAVRGVGAILTGPTVPADRAPGETAAGIGDAETQALAVRFAAAYLDTSRPQRREKRLAFLAPTFRDQTASLPSDGPGTRVAMATVARTEPLGGSRAMITVATTSATGAERDLAVPIGRDRRGRPHVIGAPALVPLRHGRAADSSSEELAGPHAAAVRDLVRRFLPPYVAGRDVRYYLAPSVNLASFSRGLELVDVEDVVADSAAHVRRGELAVIASAIVRDNESPATYRLDYRLRIARTDRWYVTAVIGGPRS